ncbi:MAG: cyclic nucleotide-binding domain-containing protein [Gammaproteobacteria bacterium]|nr:cyclic nucleotide-binding domain-containing protein [Gammaproteobacteria bacterium]
MSAAKQLPDHKLLRSLSPLCDLSPDMLAELSGKSRVTQVVTGATIFKQGERDHRTLYLVTGKLELTDASGKTTKLVANSKQARQPLDPASPHTVTAVAKTPVSLLNIDTDLLEMLLNWGGKQQSYEVSSLAVEEDDTDWMSRFLQSKVFLKLRAENIQTMIMRMEEIKVRADEIVINQDDDDDNYYIIAKGKAKVARRVAPGAPLMKLAILTPGTGFGEEALISNGKRNASVTMMEDGTLMRLSKEDFISLLVTPILQYVSFDEAKAMTGPDVQWLDVRKLAEYSRGSLPGARNIQLAEMRLQLRKLNKLHKYIVFSDGGSRAAAAVFLLNQYGLDAFVLRDGLNAVSASALEKNASKPPAAATQTSAQTSTQAKSQDVPTLKPEDNVVSLHGEAATGKESDGRVEALMSKAKQRVQQEMQRTQAADNARKQALSEVARLKEEAAVARKKAEDEARRAADHARSEAERAAAQKRADDLAAEQAEREAAVQQAEAETARAEQAMQAQKKAEEEIEHLKLDAAKARRDMEAQARQSADTAKKETEGEIIRLKAEAEMARQRVEEQARLAADAARSETERKMAQQRAEEVSRHQQEAESALQKAEIEAMRAQQAEAARQQAEDEAERMRTRAEETQREMEEQARLAADQARSEAERDAAQQRAEDLAEQQEELEDAVSKAESEAARAQAAESEVERLTKLANEARLQAEAQARMAADQARSEAEREMAAQRAQEMGRLQAEREEMARRAEDEACRTRAAEEARLQAEAEIQRLKVDAEVARMQLEEQAQRVADAARSDAEREAMRAQAAEEARLQAVYELERLETETEQTRLAAEAQARLAVDAARSEAERAAASLRAEELAQQQAQLEEITRRAEEEATRAEEADAARQRAENEIIRRQAEAEEAERRAAEESNRAHEAEAARQQMENEMAQLRAEAAAAREQVEKQARLFAAAQKVEAEEAQKNSLAAMDAERKKREAAEAVAQQQAQQQKEVEVLAEQERLADAEVTRRKQEMEDVARIAKEEAVRAQQVAEKMRQEAEEEIKHLKAEAEASRLQAELEHKRSIIAARREVDKNKIKLAAQAKAKKAAAIQQRKKADSDKARRAREAREAALKAIGKNEESLDDFMELEAAAEEIAEVENAIIVDEKEIAARAKDRSNLIDPREVMKVEKQEQKRQWVSDDFIWEATLGYRDDPHVDAVGSPADSVGVENERNQKAEKIAEEKVRQETVTQNPSIEFENKPAAQKPLFETQDINRSIRPQQDVTTRKSKRGPSAGWITGAALFLVIISGVGWFYLSGDDAPKKLKAVVNQGTETLSEITDKVTSTIGEIGQPEPEASASSDIPEITDTQGKEAIARLRERLESIKAEAAQKTSVETPPVVAAPAVAEPLMTEAPVAEVLEETPSIPNIQTEEPTATEEHVLETVDDVMKALNAPEAITEAIEPEATLEAVKPEIIESETTDAVIEEGGSIVDPVDNLPIADKVIDVDVTVTEPAVEIAAPVAITSDIVTEESGDSNSDGMDVLAPKEEPPIESVIPPGQ